MLWCAFFIEDSFCLPLDCNIFLLALVNIGSSIYTTLSDKRHSIDDMLVY